MKYSVIVPTYNSSKYLSRCLNSILEQTFDDYEVLIVDDGSIDKTKDICDFYVKTDSRFKYFYKENGGSTSSRKYAVKNATGDYIVCVDSDDLINPDLFKHLNNIIASDEPDLIYFNYRVVFENGNVKVSKHKVDNGLYTDDKLETLKKSFLYNEEEKGWNNGTISYNLWTKAFKRNIFLSAQNSVPDSIIYGEDLVLIAKSLTQVKSLFVTDYVGYDYYHYNDSISHNRTNKFFNQIKMVSEQLKLIEEKIKVSNYVFLSILGEAKKASRDFKASSFSRYFLDCEKSYGEVFDLCAFSKFYKPNLAQRIVHCLVLHKHWFLLFLVCKCSN